MAKDLLPRPDEIPEGNRVDPAVQAQADQLCLDVVRVPVKLEFEGYVLVPGGLSPADQKRLAYHYALTAKWADRHRPATPEEGAELLAGYAKVCSDSAIRTSQRDWERCVIPSQEYTIDLTTPTLPPVGLVELAEKLDLEPEDLETVGYEECGEGFLQACSQGVEAQLGALLESGMTAEELRKVLVELGRDKADESS